MEVTIQLGTLVAILVPIAGVFFEYVRRNRQLTKMITDAVSNLKDLMHTEHEGIKDRIRSHVDEVNGRINRTNERMQVDYVRREELTEVKAAITDFRTEQANHNNMVTASLNDLVKTFSAK